MTNQDQEIIDIAAKPPVPEQRTGIAPKPVTLHELEDEILKRVSFIDHEFIDGFNLIKHQPKSVTIYGSARAKENTPYYDKARSISAKLAKQGYSIVTGGGQGIMEGASRGARDSHGRAIGLNIKLPHEQLPNPYVSQEMTFYYFFTRKVMLSFSAEAYLFFPGGYGTLDEFFEILTLVQTNKIERVPIFLVGVDYWSKLMAFLKETLVDKYKTVDSEDLELFTITDDEDLIVETVKKAPIRNGIRLPSNFEEEAK